MSRILGIDLGDVRTGLALSDLSGSMASGVCTITEYVEKRLVQRICAFITENEVSEIVMGLPVNMDGSIGFRAEKVKNFAKLLEEESGLAVQLYDERCSTMLAHTYLNATNKRGKKRKQVVDTLSAEIILQNYLDKKNRN